MFNRMNRADLAVIKLMDSAVENLRRGEHAYEVALSMMHLLSTEILTKSAFGGHAYVMWAEISDLLDDPRGPHSEQVCSEVAQRTAAEWTLVDRGSRQAVKTFFEDEGRFAQ